MIAIAGLPAWEQKAFDFARLKHEGHFDDEGFLYFYSHIIQVVNIIRTVTQDEEIIQAAYLHDTIEDTKTTYEELVQEFGQRVADLVMEITHEGDKNKGYYFPRLHSKDGILLKFADRLSNLSRMSCWHPDRQDHYLKKSKFWKSTKDEK